MKTEKEQLVVYKQILDQLRSWLKDGATITASDPNGRVLEVLPDGTCHSGLKVVCSPK